ncbi:hypothetical protein HG536_0C00770 [Torulaspora globosa]|uniref:PCI domain-containing protein n=1 Tax=Torulaspora globosa TaxID=48254 RepID=A0A7G3ZEH4_9SACH|nr:uncharacterized protein HG536_0C00770 [Torulaspora globosa]QLL31910.1 hypothetical protein HG536_0C00770 [Torulaspora globosa]
MKSTAMDRSFVELLESPQRFHYKELWLQETDPLRRKVLELFAFGTVQHIQEDIPMTAGMLRKLQQLSIISLSERLRELPYGLIEQECGIRDTGTIEESLIRLRAVFEVRLDSPAQLATIERWFDCRDVYGGERELLIVPPPPTTRESLIQDLQRWHRKLHTDILGRQPPS